MRNDGVLRIYTDGGCAGNQNDENVLRNYYLVLTVVNVDIQVAKHMQVLLQIMKLKLIYVSQLVLM